MSELEKKLLELHIKEPNRDQLENFKKEYLYRRQRIHIARTARKFINDLETCIVYLKDKLDTINKL